MGRLALPVLQHTSTMAEEKAPNVAKNKVADADKAAVRVKLALRKLVAAKKVVPAAAAGKKGAGSFKLPAKEPAAKKPKAKKAKKPAAKKAAKKPAKKAAPKKK